MSVELALGSLGAWLASSFPPDANLQYEHSRNESRILHGIHLHIDEDGVIRPKTYRQFRYLQNASLPWKHLSL